MKLIDSKVDVIKQLPELEGAYKQIELAGRTCYKSEDKITEDSAKQFVDRMIKSAHGAMLEHGTVYLEIPYSETAEYNNIFLKYYKNPYSRFGWKDKDSLNVLHITTNLRVIIENGWEDDLKYICEPTKYHEKRITVRFTCDRGVSHEFVRHRVFSFAMESQRYCNYSKDKFNNEITFIKPTWFDDERAKDNESPECRFIDSLDSASVDYFRLLQLGLKPQEARALLPNATKTELVMTGFRSDWDHFFELRCSTAAHPDAKKLADELKEIIDK